MHCKRRTVLRVRHSRLLRCCTGRCACDVNITRHSCVKYNITPVWTMCADRVWRCAVVQNLWVSGAESRFRQVERCRESIGESCNGAHHHTVVDNDKMVMTSIKSAYLVSRQNKKRFCDRPIYYIEVIKVWPSNRLTKSAAKKDTSALYTNTYVV